MNFNSPGWAQIAIFILFSISTVRSQHESHEGTNGKNHLHGIKRLSIQRLSEARPVQVPSQGTKRFMTNLTPAIVSAEALEPPPLDLWNDHSRKSELHRRVAPFAVMPVMDSHESINYERRVNLLPVNAHAHAAPTQILNQDQPRPSFRPSTVPPSHDMTQKDLEKQRIERIEARWRKIGFTGRPIQSSYPYSKMRLVHYAAPVSWTHAPTLEKATVAPTTTTPKPTTTSTARVTTTRRAITPPKTRQFLPDVIKPVKEEPMIRRINKHPIHVETGIPQLHGNRAYGPKSFFNGPILEDKEEEIIVPPSKPITVSRESFANEDTDGIIVQDTSKTDYHSRSQNPVPVKRFKLTNKLSYRPRLKIRRPEEQFAARGESNAKSYPLAIPELAPLDNRRPLPSSGFEEPTNAFMARHRIHPNQRPQGLQPLPSPILGGEQNIQVEPPPFASRNKPKVTGWGDEQDFGEVVTEDNEFGGGDSGAGFGGEIGTPPPGFQESFGLNGATTELVTTRATPPPTTTTRRPKRPPKTPPPDEPFVIPENSGLRPVAPPREFKGGFGSSKGSSLSGFGGGGGSFGGGGGGSGFGAPPSPSSYGPKPKGRGRKPPPQPEPTEEVYYTGDSALVPNKRGPSGDGFGPPLPPDSAPPPPVPPIGIGGGAAGIPPGMMRGGLRGVNPDNENSATTVKPSALLSILNKADEGFNQAITHFERGTPIETAAIDILEVALGSQRLDSQAKLLGHVDRTIGLDNLQRLQRWANTGGAFDMLKEQLAKMAKNYKVPEPTVTLPPQFEYLFQPTG